MSDVTLWRDGKRTPEYIEALRGQIQLWMRGVSTHNRASGECCPDFSCCHPEMLLAPEKRRRLGMKELLEWSEVQ